MKTLISKIAIFFMACLLGTSLILYSQNASSLFEQGLMKENAEGDLTSAIAVFNRIVEDRSADPSIRAKAQLHIGMCYEKLGQREARAAYQKVIDGFPKQLREVAEARERMARLIAASKENSSGPIYRKIQIANRFRPDAQLSPDGKSIAFANKGWLWIAPTSSKLGRDYLGAPRQLDTQGVEADWCGIAWSGDGQWIAFNGNETNEGRQKIYVVSANGGKPRQIFENNRHARVVNYRMSLSPHGDIIAFSSMDGDAIHIYKKPVAEGLPERLVDTPAREPVFSPDGKMIAYVENRDLGRAGGGVWVVPANGGQSRMVADAGNASSPVWSPDGKMLAFVDYAADEKIHILQFGPDGNPSGEKISIDCPEGTNGVGRIVGWTPDNVMGVIAGSPTEFALYAQPVEGGEARFVTHGGYPMQPRWSPDGERIYHINDPGDAGGDWDMSALSYVPAEGGDVTTVPLQSETKIRLWAYGAGNRVSPDGKTIVFAGQKHEEERDTMHIWTIPVDGGVPRQLTDAPVQDWYPCWSPDGVSIAFVRATSPENWAVIGAANIFIVPAEGGEVRQISSASDRVFPASPVLWSPDGKLLAYFSRDNDDKSEGTIKTIPVGGGKPQIVAKVQQIFANKELAWSPDGRKIAFNALQSGTTKSVVSNLIRIVSLDDGSIEEINPDLKDVEEIYHLDWSPNGKILVFGGYTGHGGPQFWTIENFLTQGR